MMLLEMLMTGAVLVFVWSSPASSDPALTLLPSNSALTAQHCFESPEICKYWHWNCGEFMQNFVWFLCLFLAWLRMSKNLSVLCPEPMFPCFNVKVWELWHLGLEHGHINTVPQSRWHFTNYSPLQLAEPLPLECIMYCTEEGKTLRWNQISDILVAWSEVSDVTIYAAVLTLDNHFWEILYLNLLHKLVQSVRCKELVTIRSETKTSEEVWHWVWIRKSARLCLSVSTK